MIPELARVMRDTARRALASIAALGLLLATPAAAEPAMWVVKDADSTIYLMGTVHVLRPDTAWRDGKVAAALASTRELILEATSLDDMAVMQPLIRKYGLDPANPLSGKLSEKDRVRLAAAAQAVGLPPQALEPMQPWLAGLTLAVAPAIKAGYDPKSGVEMVLMGTARAGGWSMVGLETPEAQIRSLAELPPKVQLGFLTSTLDDMDTATAQLDAMVTAWSAGDTAALETLFVTEMKTDYPDLYQALVVRRNEAWARALAEKLKGSGVSFVAVGAGHVVGPDSVQAQLAKLGIKAERQ